MKTFKALGALLDYPTDALKAALPEIHACLISEGMLASRHRHALIPLLDALRDRELLDLQEGWVDLFDRSRRLALHLHEHTYGESRDRGMAMVRLAQTYRMHGLEPPPDQTPDYLPLFCEFLSTLPPPLGKRYLGDAAAVLEVLAERLEAKDSLYAAVLRGLATLSARPPEADEVALLREQAPEEADSLEALDQAYEEAPVDFTAASVLQSCPYGADAAGAPRPPRSTRGA
jgi:nitrate reductase delta subunit